MRHDSSSDLLTITQNVLRQAFGGLYTHTLRRAVNNLGIEVSRDQLAATLLDAQRAGEFTFPDRRWHIDGRPVGRVPFPTEGTSSKHPSQWLTAIPTDVLPGNLGSDHRHKNPESLVEEIKGWDLLRRLLPHYSECLRRSGAGRLVQYADRWTKQFHLLQPNGRWWPDEAGPRHLRIDLGDLGGDFLEGLYKRRTDPVLLGYPIAVSHGPEERIFIHPVGLLKCHWEVDQTALVLWPIEQFPRLNPEWVGKNRRRRDFRKTHIWLRESASTEQSGVTAVGDEGWVDVPDMAQSLSMFLARDLLTRLDPARISNRLDLAPDESIQNVIGLFLVGENVYTQGCRRDLGNMLELSDGEFGGTALAPIFGSPAPAYTPIPVLSPLDLGEDQFVATRDALQHNLTIISGPPGTGKSQVVCALMLSAMSAGRTVLFASHTHKAIDAVQERLDELTPDQSLLARASPNPSDNERAFDFGAAVNYLLSHMIEEGDPDALTHHLASVAGENHSADALISSADTLNEVTLQCSRLIREQDRRRWSNVTSTDLNSSVEPIKLGLLHSFLSWILRFSSKSRQQAIDSNETDLSDAQLRRQIRDIEQQHRRATADMEDITKETSLADILERIKQASLSSLVHLAKRIGAASVDERKRLTQFQGQIGLAADAEGARELWKENADLVLKHFPLWASTTLSIPNRMPLVPALFDYLIIDEATTCNIAQCLPLLLRAKKAIVVGDRLQLGMVNDMDGRREDELLRAANLNHPALARFSFSQISFFDLANSVGTAQRHILRDHFRCDPEIASYFSETFYDNRLFVRTDTKGLKAPPGTRTGMHWTHVVGPLERAGKGCRSQSEARAIADHLYDLIEVQRYGGTVGVVTPFNSQRELILHLAEEKISRERIDATDLLIATSHKFQGGARDVILMSLCYGKNMPRGAEWFLRNSRELINVAVSRAKAVCHVFGNRDDAASSSIRHIARLTYRSSSAETYGLSKAPEFESPWERKLFEGLVAAGMKPLPQYPVVGRRLDLALIKDGVKLDVEVDGETYHRDPDGFRKVSDHWRDHVIQSAGWRVCRFWVYQLRDDMEACVERVRKELG